MKTFGRLSDLWALILAAGIIAVPAIGARADAYDDFRQANDGLFRRAISAMSLRDFFKREPTEAEVSADMSWDLCKEHAADLFALQPETAAAIVEAAIASCSVEAIQLVAALKLNYNNFVESEKPALMARVMAFRAAHQGRTATPAIAPPSSSRTFNQ